MNFKTKKILCLLLALGLTLALGACGKSSVSGGKAPGNSATPEFTYSAQFKSLPLPQVTSFNPAILTDTGFYYNYMEKSGERPIPQGLSLEYEGQYDILQPRIAFCDFDGNIKALEGYSPNLVEADYHDRRDYTSTTNICKLLMNPQGNLVVLENIYRSWSDAPDNVKADDPEYYDSLITDNIYYVQVLDSSSGAALSSSMLELDDPDSLSPYNAHLDDKGNILLSTQSGSLEAFSMDGKPAYKIEFNGYIYSMFTLKNGQTGVLLYDMDEPDFNKATAIHVIDSDKGSFQPDSYPLDSTDILPGGGEYDAYYTSGGYLCGYNLGDEKGQPLFKWTGCDVNDNFVRLVQVGSDGVVHGLSLDDNEDDSASTEYFSIAKIPYSAAPKKTVLNMAVMYVDYSTQDAVIKFNRSHDNARIELIDYSEYNNEKDWSAGLTKLTTEIMAGNMPDIIFLSPQIPYRQLAAKGLLEDLYPYIQADSSFDLEDFFPNVFSALETNGKLCAVCSGFSVQTVVGASSVVGDKPGWTYDDYYAALATMPEGCEGFDVGTNRQGMLSTCLGLDMAKFVDWGTGSCNFDSSDFIKLLEFSRQFPDKSYFDNYEYSDDDNSSTRISQGKQMLTTASFTSTDYMLYDLDKMFGGSATCIGYPTGSGVGSFLSMGDCYAMSSSCKDKDAAWQFLRTFLTEEHQAKGSYLPTNMNAFNRQLENAMEIKYQKDANGNYILDENGERKPIAIGMFSDGINIYEIYAVSPHQAEQLREVINTSTKLMDNDQSITDIVLEQAAAYFAGQKSAEEVARLIQSKVNIYINEQR